MISSGIVIMAHVLVGLLALTLWATREFRAGIVKRSGLVPSRVYRILEKMRLRLFQNSRDVRFTVFIEDPNKVGTLVPVARLGWGKPASVSSARFRIGEGLAGEAWKHRPSTMFFAAMNSPLAPEAARELHKTMFHLSDAAAHSLSDQQLQARVQIALNLGRRETIGVLCIDSLRPDVVNPQPEFWRALHEMGIGLALEVERLVWQSVRHREELGSLKQRVLRDGDGSVLKEYEFASGL
jgi:hypothetical protein